MLRELGVDFYRFSVSWTRILPTSFPDKINKAGVAYYNNLIEELLKYRITPVVTIFHWDLPQKLQELGGWANPYMVDWYADYARTLFKLFGDRVKYWVTINEPQQICYLGYGKTMFAPAVNIKGIAEYLCARNVLLAHAKAYHIYDKEFRKKQKGLIFISVNCPWYEPLYESQTDAADDANQFDWEQYAHPIFSKTGDFPPATKKRIAARSAEQGFPRSRLPEFTPQEIQLIKGSSDLFGINHYFSQYVYRNKTVYRHYESPSYDDDLSVFFHVLPEWSIGQSNFTKFVPWGFYKLLTYIRKEYANPPVYITENGFSTLGGLNDNDRVFYHTEYLSAMLDAMEEGSDVRAYTAWSLMDNFEWSFGYTSLSSHNVRKFPDGFLFGTATASYQVEGAWNASDIKGVADYMCAKNLLLAHARAYHIYDKEFRPTQKGNIFISFSSQWHEPLTEDGADVEGASNAYQFHLDHYAHPVFSKIGGFPPIMIERIAAKSATQGFPKSRLPEFTPAEIELVRGSSDFFGLNHYTTSYVYRNESTYDYHEAPSYLDDLEILEHYLPEWTIGESDYIKEDYENPPVFITENGLATYGGLDDDDRVSYYRGYLSAMLDAIDEGCDVRAYTAWSLLDNFEWLEGYTQCFGLYEVDYKSPNRMRTARKSAHVYKEIVRTRALDQHYEPDMSKAITIDKGY
ncbi:jg21024 [Pararge aegeria aegeria]|uniref:beta-glucosidase n=1 Tax=Pararge aegeria aegeria TaxID=348720 RepID=A0A8S4RTX1_9NEOP|nr:jg21024 [Pararge aegeria aegeria]